MVGEAIAGLGALKTAFDMAKGLKDISDAATRNAAIIELQEKIITAQSAQAALVGRVSDLEKKVASFETWGAEKKRYSLQNVGLGSLAYVLKPDAEPPEHPHSICAECYQHRKKSILQIERRAWNEQLKCPECKTLIAFEVKAPAFL
jgi:hypothetical protein